MTDQMSATQRDQLQQRLAMVGELLAVDGVAKHDTRFDSEVALVADEAADEQVARIVASHMGEPSKPAGAALPDGLDKDPMVEAFGGLRADQTLYRLSLGDSLEVYVALWPWGGGKRITIKIGVYGNR